MNNRFQSLDVFRGITLALMILVNNPGNEHSVYVQLEHSVWNGCTLTDLIFPFFLFAVGNSMAFAFSKMNTESRKVFWFKVIKRSLLIFFIGVFLDSFPFFYYDNLGRPILTAIQDFRIFGVLQRIALCYFLSAVILTLVKDKGIAIICLLILLFYWVLCVALNPADPFSLNGWFGTNLEKLLIGENHMYKGEGVPFEPEGIMSLPAAIVQCLFGYLVGKYIFLKGKTSKMLITITIVGFILLIAGYLWGYVFPINKKIWTSSYTIFTTGAALLILSFLIYIIEFKKVKFLTFFEVFGANTLFIYILSTIIPKIINVIRMGKNLTLDGEKVDFTIWNYSYIKVFEPLFSDPRNSSLLLAICFVLLLWCIAFWLNFKKLYIKI